MRADPIHEAVHLKPAQPLGPVRPPTWMLGVIGLQAADVPGLLGHEDLRQFQQAALELGRHLQTQQDGHESSAPTVALSGTHGLKVRESDWD